jgi:hypothetical protein
MTSRVPFLLTCLFTALSVGNADETTRPIPRIDRTGAQYTFLVDGRSFLILGGQAHNSSATNPQDLEAVWKALVSIHANTAEVPIYWELIEPVPGKFDFQLPDEIIAGARRNGLRLVLLWFGAWKNGEMHYAPEWVKREPEKYKRAKGPRGDYMEILSPTCEAVRNADAKAFAAVMQHIKSVDEADRTVIMMQVENETGLLGTDRDYSEEATRLFSSAVPPELMNYLTRNQNSLTPDLKAAWSVAGFRKSGTWPEVFGEFAAEVFSAWHMARYVDAVAASGKQAYPLPMYANNWLINPGNERPGRWPSGGPTEHVLDIWKAAAPHIDLLSPDIYLPKYYETCLQFTRPDNPLFVPETIAAAHYAGYAFLALARFNGLGVSPFGVDGPEFLQKGSLTETGEEYADTYRILQPLLQLIESNRYKGTMHAIVQDEDSAQVIRLSGKLAAVVNFTKPYEPRGPVGRGMMIELASDDFLVVGAGFKVEFRELEGPPRDARFLTIEEGTFEGERWAPVRRLNGDELQVSFPERSTTLRVRLTK